MSIALRVEWAKAGARADRWEEDVVVVDEEMRRVLQFCNWKAEWWLNQVPLRTGLPIPLAEGLKAYAEEQADLERRIHLAWTAKWACARELAQPIKAAVMGDESIDPALDDVQGVVVELELDIDEEHEGVAGDSDFEE
jgi:hypothetical protein